MEQRGFTLIELLVVMTIIAALTALAVPQLSSAGRAGDRPKVLIAARSALEAARQQAMASGVPTAPAFAPSKSSAVLDAVANDAGMPLLFYLDGSSSGGTVRLNGRPALVVDWLTGEIDDAR